jgi:hypothetical protein
MRLWVQGSHAVVEDRGHLACQDWERSLSRPFGCALY